MAEIVLVPCAKKKTIVLIPCSKSKRNTQVKIKAKDLYISSLFKKGKRYAELRKPDAIYILSDKYHLLELEDEVEYYDVSIKDMSSEGKKAWGKKVIAQLEQVADLGNDKFIILAGEHYLKQIKGLENIELPLKGQKQGVRLRTLNKEINRLEQELNKEIR